MNNGDIPDLAYSQSDRSPVVASLVSSPVNLNIAAADEMYQFCLSQNGGWRDMALAHYLRSARLGVATIETVLSWYQKATGVEPKILDFASGYGRTTRFLVARHDPDRIWVSDIQSEGVDFQRREFGVHGFASCADPEALVVDERFDLIFVLSLFSHLPDVTFSAWLKKLHSLLSERGCLVFSTLGESSLPAGTTLPGEGFLFSSLSESAVLPGEQYGTLWASTAYVGQRIAACCPGASWKGFPKTLWHLQDLYVVATPGSGADLAALEVEPGPRGYLERVEILAPNHLFIAGWALDPGDSGREVRIEIQVGDAPLLTTTPSHARAEISSALGVEAGAPTGWSADYRHPERNFLSTDVVMVRVKTDRSEMLLHAAVLDSTFLTWKLSALQQELDAETQRVRGLQAEVAREREASRQKEERIAHMERSRFWKVRNLWFRLTGRD